MVLVKLKPIQTPTREPTNHLPNPMGAIVQLYLRAYNVAMVIGWAIILVTYLTTALATGFNADAMYPKLSLLLQIFQYGAILEVPSPTLTTRSSTA